ncbi:MAG: amidohydrolase family protein [Bacteroidetes bacterium]|nr:amidohydrolase family protein [Bacteroidota bacterium]
MILLKNGTYIDWQTLEFKKTDILAEPGVNGSLHFSNSLINGSDPLRNDEYPASEGIKTIDCAGKFITRSFANGHHHVYSALARGMPAPKKNPENFPEILQYIWWNLDKALDLKMIRSSALVTAIACAKNGVTFVIDHHASPFAPEGSLETIAQAFDEVGVGHLLCYEISDRDGLEIAQKGLSETAGYLSKREGLVGLHASFTVGGETLKQAVQMAAKTNSGIHVHVAEDTSDEIHCMEHYHQRVIERLSDNGVLQFPKTILAHCLHLDEHERGLVEGSPAWVVQNMESNLNNSVGFFNSKGLGQRIMFGTDGMHSDMLRSAKAAFFAGHNFDNIDYGETYRRFRNVHHYLHANGFTGDGENNLVVLDYDSPTPLTSDNFYGHFLFGIESRHVSHVIAQGKVIVEHGIVMTVDEKEILKESHIQAGRLWKKMR